MTPRSHTTKAFSVLLVCPTHPRDKAVLLVSSVCATCRALNRDGGNVHLPCSLCTRQTVLLSHRGACSHMITATLGVGAVLTYDHCHTRCRCRSVPLCVRVLTRNGGSLGVARLPFVSHPHMRRGMLLEFSVPSRATYSHMMEVATTRNE
jgi:hypothetical protein